MPQDMPPRGGYEPVQYKVRCDGDFMNTAAVESIVIFGGDWDVG